MNECELKNSILTYSLPPLSKDKECEEMKDKMFENAMKESCKHFFKEKHKLDITIEKDRKTALKWLETAAPNDMFFTDVPIEKAEDFDLVTGAMRKAVFADILVKW